MGELKKRKVVRRRPISFGTLLGFGAVAFGMWLWYKAGAMEHFAKGEASTLYNLFHGEIHWSGPGGLQHIAFIVVAAVFGYLFVRAVFTGDVEQFEEVIEEEPIERKESQKNGQ